MKGEYYQTKESVEEYITLAKDVSGQQLIDQMREVLPQNSNVLELGSGPGTDWKILSQTYRTVGSDNSAEFIAHLTQTNPSGEFLNLSAESIETDRSFDGIYSNKVLHHLKDSELQSSIKKQSEILPKDGIVCHSFWKGEGSEIFKGLFVNYHISEDLRRFFEPYFDIFTLSEYQEFEKGDSLFLIGRKK